MGSLCSWPSTWHTVASISSYVLSSASSFSRGSTVVLQIKALVQSQQGPTSPTSSHPAQGPDSHDLLQTLGGRPQGVPLWGGGTAGEAPVPQLYRIPSLAPDPSPSVASAQPWTEG